MLRVFRDKSGSFSIGKAQALPGEIIWIDLLNPTDAEKQFVADRAGVHVPSTEALSEIEASSRLAVEGEVIYLSTPVVARADTIDASLSPVGFILTRTVLVTIRSAELKAFGVVSALLARDESISSSTGVFIALLEAVVDRGADVLESLAGELDRISRSIFRGDPAQRRHAVRSNTTLRSILFAVGSYGRPISACTRRYIRDFPNGSVRP
jgi:magnesium transporter